MERNFKNNSFSFIALLLSFFFLESNYFNTFSSTKERATKQLFQHFFNTLLLSLYAAKNHYLRHFYHTSSNNLIIRIIN